VAGCNFIACMHHAHPATFLHVRRLASRMLTIFSAVCATKRYFCGPGKHVYIESSTRYYNGCNTTIYDK